MIRELHIRDLALIDDLSLEFEEGFSVLTGETGAGKSILISAMGLLLGERAVAEQIRSGAEEAEVSGVLELSREDPALKALLTENNIPHDDDTLIIRRRIQHSGKNRVWINQVPLPLGSLKKIGDLLIDLHGQHEHQSLLYPETAYRIINGLPEVKPVWEQYCGSFSELSRLREELAQYDRRAAELRERRDMIDFQYKELAALSLKTGEETTLEAELKFVSSATQRAECAAEIARLLGDGDDAMSRRMGAVRKRLVTLAKFDASVQGWLKDLDSAGVLISELESFCGSYLARTQGESDPARLDFINTRLAKIQRFKKKYQCDGNELLLRQERLKTDLAALDNSESDRAQLAARVAQALALCKKEGAALGRARTRASTEFDRTITDMMARLGFTGGAWKTQFAPLDEPESIGCERIEFFVCANPGEPFLPLSRTASGGEISRFMLAIKTVMAQRDNIPVLIFDEIDTGIGGVVANEVAQCLYRLGKTHQVFCISHLHQIASIADNHFTVYKEVVDGRTITRVKGLSKEEKVGEIARMLGGESDIARKHAAVLLKRKNE